MATVRPTGKSKEVRQGQGARTSRAMSEKSLDVEDSRAAAWFTMPLVSSSFEELASMAPRSRLAHTPSSQTGRLCGEELVQNSKRFAMCAGTMPHSGRSVPLKEDVLLILQS